MNFQTVTKKNPRRRMEKLMDLQNEIKELTARLAEAEETLNAIRNGEVDALAPVRTGDGQRIHLPVANGV